MFLIVLHIIGKPHTLPLVFADLTRFEPFSVDCWHEQDTAWLILLFLGLEDVHTFKLRELFLTCLAFEEVNLDLRFVTRHDIVFGGHLLTHTV